MTKVQALKIIRSMRNLSALNGGQVPSEDEWLTVIKSRNVRVVGYERDAFLELYEQGAFGKIKEVEGRLGMVAVEAEPSTLLKATRVGTFAGVAGLGLAVTKVFRGDNVKWAKRGIGIGVVTFGLLLTTARASDRRLWTLIIDTDVIKDLF